MAKTWSTRSVEISETEEGEWLVRFDVQCTFKTEAEAWAYANEARGSTIIFHLDKPKIVPIMGK